MSDDKPSFRPKVLLPDPWSPPENWEAQNLQPPENVFNTRRRDEVLYIAGEGKVDGCDVMVLHMSATESHAEEGVTSRYGSTVQTRPAYTRGPVASILRNAIATAGYDPDAMFTTAYVKWLLPKEHRKKPKHHELAWARPAFAAEIRRVKPKVIVTLGKPVFDLLYNKHKFKLGEIAGGWFPVTVEGHECQLYPMENPEVALLKPEYIGKFRQDFAEVASGLKVLNGGASNKVPIDYRVIRNSTELRAWVAEMMELKPPYMATDCEWEGINHIKGKLRTIQFAWAPGKAVVIRFCDPAPDPETSMTYSFDIPYREVGDILRPLINTTKLVGHLLAADLVWLKSWLGVDFIGRCGFDTLFAMQTVDEYQEAKLERMAVLRTDLGRYDIPLQIWKKENKLQDNEGYGRVIKRVGEMGGFCSNHARLSL